MSTLLGGVALASVLPFISTQAFGLDASDTVSQASAGEALSETLIEAAPVLPLNGLYLYGQAAQPDQVGAVYMVFEARDGVALGAFYMPNSSFDCFYGSLRPAELALTVIDSYSQDAFPYAVAIAATEEVADADGGVSLGLEIDGYYQLPELSEGDRRVLAVCRRDLADQVW
ncbi:MAG: hypothetical protein AAF728_20835 [Cyanobacteria bacterium P01_D01_bin.128]